MRRRRRHRRCSEQQLTALPNTPRRSATTEQPALQLAAATVIDGVITEIPHERHDNVVEFHRRRYKRIAIGIRCYQYYD